MKKILVILTLSIIPTLAIAQSTNHATDYKAFCQALENKLRELNANASCSCSRSELNTVTGGIVERPPISFDCNLLDGPTIKGENFVEWVTPTERESGEPLEKNEIEGYEILIRTKTKDGQFSTFNHLFINSED